MKIGGPRLVESFQSESRTAAQVESLKGSFETFTLIRSSLSRAADSGHSLHVRTELCQFVKADIPAGSSLRTSHNIHGGGTRRSLRWPSAAA